MRAIAAVLDLSWVYAEVASYYSKIGRPSIDPVLMIRMLIVGYVFAIRSERALCREVQVNFAYRWFCGLSIEDKLPDHSAFSRARNERFGDSAIFGACSSALLAHALGWACRRRRVCRGREPDPGDAKHRSSRPEWKRHLIQRRRAAP